MGESRDSDERDRAWADSHRGCILAPAARPELAEAAKKRIPLGRFGTTEEFANLAAFLVSDGSGYINGDVVTMDGGEWLQGAGEFTALGRELTEEEWQRMRPKKSAPKA